MDDSVEVGAAPQARLVDAGGHLQLKARRRPGAAADACVSAGNTGALMALARFLLKTLDGIDRPAIATVMPNRRDGYTTVLDLGANVDCTPEHLLQFAVMGSALVSAVDGKAEPQRRPAQHRRGSHQGQRHDQAGRRTAARGRRGRAPELPRQRRGQRHLQGHDRHRRLRRLRRQRAAQDSRRPGLDAGRLHPPGVHARPVQQAGGAGGAAGAASASSTASTRAATTARRCSACAGWSSRATARPTPTPSSRRWRGLMMRRATGCSTACTTASRPAPRAGAARPADCRHRPQARMNDRAILAIPASPAPAATCRRARLSNDDMVRAAGRARRRDHRRLDRRAHRHPRAPLRRRRRHLQRPGAARRARRARGGRPPRRGRRPDHRRHVDARHGVPVHRLHRAAQARHRTAARPSTCRPCARASSMR